MARKSNLRNKVKDHLLFQIQNGELQIGKTINLAALSRVTDISVTPIREALSQLEHSGVIRAIPNRGFIVAKLTKEEIKDLITTISELEVLALEQSMADTGNLEALAHIQQDMAPCKDLGERLQLRFAFHEALTHGCPNQVLLQLIKDLRLRLRFYEYQLVRELSFFEKMDQQTHAIVQAILQDNIPTACLILKMHWMSVLDYLSAQLDVKNG